jgi:hypothetical protein
MNITGVCERLTQILRHKKTHPKARFFKSVN